MWHVFIIQAPLSSSMCLLQTAPISGISVEELNKVGSKMAVPWVMTVHHPHKKYCRHDSVSFTRAISFRGGLLNTHT